jgi:hypothetical protein
MSRQTPEAIRSHQIWIWGQCEFVEADDGKKIFVLPLTHLCCAVCKAPFMAPNSESQREGAGYPLIAACARPECYTECGMGEGAPA